MVAIKAKNKITSCSRTLKIWETKNCLELMRKLILKLYEPEKFAKLLLIKLKYLNYIIITKCIEEKQSLTKVLTYYT